MLPAWYSGRTGRGGRHIHNDTFHGVRKVGAQLQCVPAIPSDIVVVDCCIGRVMRDYLSFCSVAKGYACAQRVV